MADQPSWGQTAYQAYWQAASGEATQSFAALPGNIRTAWQDAAEAVLQAMPRAELHVRLYGPGPGADLVELVDQRLPCGPGPLVFDLPNLPIYLDPSTLRMWYVIEPELTKTEATGG